MDPEERQLLEKNLELSRQNNKILNKIQSSMRWGKVMRTIYWIIIIGSMLGLYYYLQPFIDSFKEAYSGVLGGVEKIQDFGKSLPGIQ